MEKRSARNAVGFKGRRQVLDFSSIPAARPGSEVLSILVDMVR
jgi:hypothetical protein